MKGGGRPAGRRRRRTSADSVYRSDASTSGAIHCTVPHCPVMVNVCAVQLSKQTRKLSNKSIDTRSASLHTASFNGPLHAMAKLTVSAPTFHTRKPEVSHFDCPGLTIARQSR